ncbi:CRISPR-associated protein Cas5 [Francisella salimarina]
MRIYQHFKRPFKRQYRPSYQ